MAEKRKNDVNARSHLRTERMFMEGGQWYFHTREGTLEGPFQDQVEALRMLDAYIMTHESGIMPHRELDLVPLAG